jgi:hypothetical protein
LLVQTLKRISVGVTKQVHDQHRVKFDAFIDLLTFYALEIHITFKSSNSLQLTTMMACTPWMFPICLGHWPRLKSPLLDEREFFLHVKT